MAKIDELAVENGLQIRQMMELAGWHMVKVFDALEIDTSQTVTVLSGKGNKGGDGLSAARHLINHGWQVRVVLASREIKEDSQHHLELLRKMEVPVFDYEEDRQEAINTIQAADILIDALIGYNLNGAPRGVFEELVNLAGLARGEVIAYDIPTGMDATTGDTYNPYITAKATLTLALPKSAFEDETGRDIAGNIFLGDIGIPALIYDQIESGARPDFRPVEGGILELH